MNRRPARTESAPILEDGRLAAHWLQYSGPGTYSYDVWISASSDGGETWTPATRPYADRTQTEHGFASLFELPGSGALAAAWLDGRAYADSGSSQPYMSLRTSSTPAAEDVQVNPSRPA